MPKIDGFEVLTTIRRTPQTASVPVVILTSSRMPLDIVEAYRRGCNAYVVKPVDYREYTRTMANLIDFWGELNLTPVH
jgi:CheY-like chemotaxis protein